MISIWIQIGSNISDPVPNANNRYQFGNPIDSKNKMIPIWIQADSSISNSNPNVHNRYQVGKLIDSKTKIDTNLDPNW
jgi:hypothetical protein